MHGADVAGLLGRYGEVVGITAAPRMGKAFVRMASAEGARNAAAAFNASERGRGVPYGIRAALPEGGAREGLRHLDLFQLQVVSFFFLL